MCWKPRAAGAGTAGLGGCGEGWLGFQIHWFTEKPAKEGQGAACLVIVIVLITPAGSEQDPTLRQVPHHPLPGICTTIPSCPHHPSRASRQAWAMLCSKGGSQPASPSLSDIQGHIWGHPERAALDTTAFGRGAEGSPLVPWRLLGGRGGDPSDAQGCHQGSWLLSIIQDSAAELCRSRQAGVCGIWPRGARSARAQVTQWKAASRSVPCPYLQLFQL